MAVFLIMQGLIDRPVQSEGENRTSKVFTVIALTENNTAYTFNITVNEASLDDGTNQATLMNIASRITITPDQADIIRNATLMTIQSQDNNTLQWYPLAVDFLWIRIVYGASWHLHLNAMTAINVGNALTDAAALFAVLTGLLMAAGLPAAVTGVTCVALAIVDNDYHNMYDHDSNSDGSFDLWSDITT
jgi:hypothetical protein